MGYLEMVELRLPLWITIVVSSVVYSESACTKRAFITPISMPGCLAKHVMSYQCEGSCPAKRTGLWDVMSLDAERRAPSGCRAVGIEKKYASILCIDKSSKTQFGRKNVPYEIPTKCKCY